MSSSESEYDPLESLAEIDDDLTTLEQTLESLFAAPWQDIVAALGNMEQAKMNMIVAYGICDLIWMFLRLKGVDPDKHPVMKELDRIKTYYIKVRDAENAPKRTTKIDVAAAGRFINAAIPRTQRLAAAEASEHATTTTTTTTTTTDAEGSRASTPVPVVAEEEAAVSAVGRSSRFKMAHDATSEKLSSSGEEGEMRIVDAAVGMEAPSSKRKGKRVAAEDFLDEDPAKKGKASGTKPKKARKSTSKRS
ncbi:hypothetical protein NCC49_002586 [Naganishia albida]|nr:hypothetical protein NCC49_002586 [Naganishia albida]